MVKRQPAVHPILRLNTQAVRQPPDVAQRLALGDGHRLLQPGRAAGVLNKGEAVRVRLGTGRRSTSVEFVQRRQHARGHAGQGQQFVAELLRQFLRNHHQGCGQVGSYAGQTAAVFVRIHLEHGIGEDGGDGAQPERASEGGHQRAAVGQQQRHRVAHGNPNLLEPTCTGPGAQPKIPKCPAFHAGFIAPVGQEDAFFGRRQSGLEE